MAVPGDQLLTAEIIVRGDILAAGSDGQPTWSVFHYRRTGVATPISKSSLKTSFTTSILAPMAACLNESWSSSLVTIRMLEDPDDPATPFTQVTAGAILADRLPPFVVAFLLKRTNLRRRRHMGSLKLSPLSETDTTDGGEDNVNAACLTRLTTLATAMAAVLTDGSGNSWAPVVVSRLWSDLTVVPNVVYATQVTSVAPRKNLGTLKSRKTRSVY